MEKMDPSTLDVGITGMVVPEVNTNELEDIEQHVDGVSSRVVQLEQALNKVKDFYSNSSRKQLSTMKEKDKTKHLASCRKRQQDVSCRESAAGKRMHELMRQCGTIIRQVIDKPMDFSTIENKMEAKDGSGYKNVVEICADVRLIFENAMKYNDEQNDGHVMAKNLLAKFEEKWLQFLPKVEEEEKRRKDEEAEAKLDMQLVKEAAHAKMAKDLSIELDKLDMSIGKNSKNWRFSSADLTQLSPEDVDKALTILSESTTQDVVLELYSLMVLCENQGKSSASMDGDKHEKNNNKRKKETRDDALAKTSQERSQMLSN